MPRHHAKSDESAPARFFVKELAGETAPAASSLKQLYELAGQLYTLRPWHLLSEDALVLVLDPVSGETCHCSLMGALGQVLAMHAYIGAESYRLFQEIENSADGVQMDAGDFFASLRSVYVEFVRPRDLDSQDRKLLASLGHSLGRGTTAPIFRGIRPGYFPWFVTEEETRTLAECMHAVIEVCNDVRRTGHVNYWDREHVYPLVSRQKKQSGESVFHVRLTEAPVPEPPMLPPVQPKRQQLLWLSERAYRNQGSLEVDCFPSGMVVGKKNERKACPPLALAADADSGFLFPPEVAEPGFPPGEALVNAIMKAIEACRAFPLEVRVRKEFKDCLGPISEICGFKVKAVCSLPAVSSARASFLQMLG